MIDNQGKSDLLIPSLVSGEFTYQPRTGNWDPDIINRTDFWSDHIFDILELPYDTKMDHALFFGFYNEPYRGMLRKAIEAAKLLDTPWELELELVTAKNRTIRYVDMGMRLWLIIKFLSSKGPL